MGSDRGEIILFVLITLALIIGGVALAVGVTCDQATQKCLNQEQPK